MSRFLEISSMNVNTRKAEPVFSRGETLNTATCTFWENSTPIIMSTSCLEDMATVMEDQ